MMERTLQVHSRDWLPTELRTTSHARDQMRDRQITIGEIADALNNCDTCMPVRGNQGRAHIGPVGTRRIKVVVAVDSDPPRIITVAAIGEG